MNILGQILLFSAWALALLCFLAGGFFGFKQNYQNNTLLRMGTILVGIVGLASLVVLGDLFLTDDYTNQYVWQHSNAEMPSIYKITAIWGGMDGSMLLWAVLITFFSAMVGLTSSNYSPQLIPYLVCVLNSSGLFFLTVVLYFTNPFRFLQAGFIPTVGNGLNPLLQNPYMAIHPPTLYLGFTAFAVPYAFALASLLSGKMDKEWIKYSCRWTLIAWGFLTAGITLGGHWAYLELGWGGFWAWDPVENSSFLPWLFGTAYLHSVIVQEKRGLLKVWNVFLITGTYGLTVFGTFLTRSGIVQSVHSFAKTNIGPIFLIYLGLLLAVAVVLVIWRRKELQPEKKLESIFSREVVFLINNLIFVSICFATFWGVMFPVFSEALTGTKQAIGIPFFNAINVPLFLLMMFFMALGPLVAWKKGNIKNFIRQAQLPIISALVLAIILTWAGVPSPTAILSYSLSLLIIMAIISEYHKTGRQFQKSKNTSYVQGVATGWAAHRRKSAGYLVHIGVAVVAIGITASMSGKIEKEFSLAIGESFQVGGYQLELNELKEIDNSNFIGLKGIVTAYRSGMKLHATLHPELRRYKRNGESTTEVALKMSLKNDLYLILAGLNEAGDRASFKVYINPLQVWLWFGVLIMLFGTLIIITDKKLAIND